MATNFLQHNPTEANQDSDAQYLVDNTRTQGLGVDEIVPSIWMNKVLYQISTFVAAFGQMMSNKGYNMSDADVNALSAVLANIITNADTKPGFIVVPFSTTPVFNAALASGFRFSVNAAVTSSTLINIGFGQVLTFIIQNDNLPFTWPTNVLGAYPPAQYQGIGTVSNVHTQQFVVLEDNNAYPITSMVNQLVAFVSGLQAQITSINGTLASLQSQINTTNGNVAGLQTQINNTNNNVAGLQSQINGIQTNKQNNLGFTPVRQGGGNLQLNNTVFIGWSNGGRLRGQVDALDLGQFVFDNNMTAAIAAAISGLFAGSLGSAGWIALGSLIIQWGSTPILNPNNSQTFNFPRAFPNQCFQVNVSCMSSPSNQGRTVFTRGWNASQYTVGANGNDCSISWIAFGI